MTVDSMKMKLNAPFVGVLQVRDRTGLQSPFAIDSTNIFGYNLTSVKGRTFLRTFPLQVHTSIILSNISLFSAAYCQDCLFQFCSPFLIHLLPRSYSLLLHPWTMKSCLSWWFINRTDSLEMNWPYFESEKAKVLSLLGPDAQGEKVSVDDQMIRSSTEGQVCICN